MSQFKTFATGLACAVMLIGCGGGDDESGSPTAFSTVPAEVGVKGGVAPTCVFNSSSLVFVYGGVAPYRVDNTVPDAVTLNLPGQPAVATGLTVPSKGGAFQVNFTGGCLDPAQLIVVDKLDNQIVVKLSNVAG